MREPGSGLRRVPITEILRPAATSLPSVCTGSIAHIATGLLRRQSSQADS